MQFITRLAQCQLCYIALPAVKMCDKVCYHLGAGYDTINAIIIDGHLGDGQQKGKPMYVTFSQIQTKTSSLCICIILAHSSCHRHALLTLYWSSNGNQSK